MLLKNITIPTYQNLVTYHQQCAGGKGQGRVYEAEGN